MSNKTKKKESVRNKKINWLEMFIIVAVTAWLGAYEIMKGYKNLTDVKGILNVSLFNRIVVTIVIALLMAAIYIYKDWIARIMLFLTTVIFSILCVFNGNDIVWDRCTIGKSSYCLIMCCISLLVAYYVKDDIQKCFELIKFSDLTVKIFLIIMGVFLTILISILGYLRYKSYSNATFDFGIFAQMFEYMKRTGRPMTTVEREKLLSHFAIHFSPIYYVWLPVYALFSHPITLDVLEGVMLALPVIPIYLICKNHKIDNKIIVLIEILYIFYPAVATGTKLDVHENCFLILTILMVIYAVEKKRYVLFGLFTFLTLWIKEDAASYLMVLGLYFIVTSDLVSEVKNVEQDKKERIKTKIYGAILLAVSAIYFLVIIKLLEHFGQGVMDGRFRDLYYNQDGGMIQIIRTVFINPGYVLTLLNNTNVNSAVQKADYLIYMLMPIGLLLFTFKKKYSRLILVVPFVLINLIPSYPYMHQLECQYNFGTFALLLYIVLLNLADMKTVQKQWWPALACAVASIVMFAGTFAPYLSYYYDKYKNGKEDYKEVEEIIKTVPKDASVTVSGYYMPHFYRNLDLYDATHLETDDNKHTDYVVVDERDNEEVEKAMIFMLEDEYEEVARKDDWITVYKKVD